MEIAFVINLMDADQIFLRPPAKKNKGGGWGGGFAPPRKQNILTTTKYNLWTDSRQNTKSCVLYVLLILT